jgi:hypothetical protein
MVVYVRSRYVCSCVHTRAYANVYMLGIDERETVQIMQRVCTQLLNSGLSTSLLDILLDAILTMF